VTRESASTGRPPRKTNDTVTGIVLRRAQEEEKRGGLLEKAREEGKNAVASPVSPYSSEREKGEGGGGVSWKRDKLHGMGSLSLLGHNNEGGKKGAFMEREEANRN